MKEEQDIKALQREIKLQKEQIKQLKKLLKDSQSICHTLQKQLELNQEHEQFLFHERYYRDHQNVQSSITQPPTTHLLQDTPPQKKSKELTPALMSKIFARGIWQAKHKQYNKAIEIFLQLTSQEPYSGQCWYNLGTLYYITSQFPQARQCAQKAASLGFESAQKLFDRLESSKN